MARITRAVARLRGLPTREAVNHPGHEIRRNAKHDAYWCVDCNAWLEKACGDPDCEYCVGRPATPTTGGM